MCGHEDLQNGAYGDKGTDVGLWYEQSSNGLLFDFNSIQLPYDYYINVVSAELTYNTRTHRTVAWGGEDGRSCMPATVSGSPLGTLAYQQISFPELKWIGSGSLNEENNGVWMSWSDPGVSGYWQWSYDVSSDVEPQDNTNYEGSVSYYLRKDDDRANAQELIEDILGTNADVSAGYYVHKDHYTDSSWNALLTRMNEAAQVAYACQSDSEGFKQACVLAANAANNLKTAFANLEVEHDYTHSAEAVIIAPTCTESGIYEVKCLCGDVKTNSSSALGHKYESKVIAPTCTEDGYTLYTCASCADSYIADLTSALGHKEEFIAGKDATCTEDGITNGDICSVCGEVFEAQEVIPAYGHSYESVVIEPDCVNDGYTAYSCSNCGDVYTDNIVSALGHKAKKAEVVEVPGTDVTVKTVYCSVCNEMISEERFAKSDYKVYATVKSNDSTVLTGVVNKDYSASVTVPHGAIINVGEVNAEISMTNVASLGIGNTKTYEKTLFTGIEKTVALDKYLPAFSSATVVGKIDGIEYGYDFIGENTEYNYSITATPQDEESVKAAWQALASHVTTSEKAVDDSYVVIPAEAYVQIGTEKLVFADENASLKLDNISSGSGITSAIRAAVKLENAEELEDAQAKIFLPKGTVLSVGQSEVVLNDDATVRIYGYEESAEVNCILSKLRDCKTTEEIIKTAVVFLSDAANAINGQTVTVDVEFEHIADSEWVVVTDPECEENGLKVKYCVMCGEIASEEEIPATGHTPGEWETVLEPNCEEEGKRIKKCTLCGELAVEEAIPAVGHAEQIINAVVPTCTKEGLQIVYCMKCSEVVSESVIPATGHTEEIIPGKAPTNTETGLTDGVKCSVCGEILVPQEVISTLGSALTGSVTSYGYESFGETTIELYAEGAETPAYTLSVSGTGKQEYSIDSVAEGTYRAVVSKKNHVTREYTIVVSASGASQDMKIHLIGDITGDGRVGMPDLASLNSYLTGALSLDSYAVKCADVTEDGRVGMPDLAKLNSYITGLAELWK